MISTEIAEFGRRLGLTDLSLEERPLSMDIEGIGKLTLELKSEPGVPRVLTVMLSSVTIQDPAEETRRLLRAADWRSNPPYTIQCGSLNDRVFALTRLEEGRIQAAEIENALRYLATLLNG